jgi:hypothetical protein
MITLLIQEIPLPIVPLISIVTRSFDKKSDVNPPGLGLKAHVPATYRE